MDNHDLLIYNTLTRTKQKFVPLQPGHVGMYVCGPTVYGDAHLGHARPAVTFDLVFRYLNIWAIRCATYATSPTWDTSSTMPTKAKTRLPKRHASNSSNRWRWRSIIPIASTTR